MVYDSGIVLRAAFKHQSAHTLFRLPTKRTHDSDNNDKSPIMAVGTQRQKSITKPTNNNSKRNHIDKNQPQFWTLAECITSQYKDAHFGKIRLTVGIPVSPLISTGPILRKTISVQYTRRVVTSTFIGSYHATFDPAFSSSWYLRRAPDIWQFLLWILLPKCVVRGINYGPILSKVPRIGTGINFKDGYSCFREAGALSISQFTFLADCREPSQRASLL